MGTKICSTCRTEKPHDDYHRSKRSVDGVSYRRAQILQATPKWFCIIDKKILLDLNEHAQQLEKITGVTRHVDHVIPLQGKNVCGLHCRQNWQVLPGPVNNKKNNYFEG